MSPELSLIYVTTKDKTEAEKISTHLLNKKLIACSNIIPNMTSSYFWDGNLESSDESILIVKTLTNNFTAIDHEVQKTHSYDNPCVIELPIKNCSAKYKDWLIKQLK